MAKIQTVDHIVFYMQMHLIRIVLLLLLSQSLEVVPPGLHQVLANPGNLLEIWNWTLYGSRLFFNDS